MSEESNSLEPDINVVNQLLENSKKEWNRIYALPSLKSAETIINTRAQEYTEGSKSDIKEVEKAMIELEGYSFNIQKEYNMILAKESDIDDAYSNSMVYYSLNVEGKTEKEKEKKALASQPVLISLQKIVSFRRKSRMYLEKMCDRIENYVSTLKKSHTRRTGIKVNSD